jgi:hypothetical protein
VELPGQGHMAGFRRPAVPRGYPCWRVRSPASMRTRPRPPARPGQLTSMVCLRTAPFMPRESPNPHNHCTRFNKNVGANDQATRFILRGCCQSATMTVPRERPHLIGPSGRHHPSSTERTVFEGRSGAVAGFGRIKRGVVCGNHPAFERRTGDRAMMQFELHRAPLHSKHHRLSMGGSS